MVVPSLTDAPTQGSVNQPFIIYKKRGIISERECPFHNITLHNKSFDTSSRYTLPNFTKYLYVTLPLYSKNLKILFFTMP